MCYSILMEQDLRFLEMNFAAHADEQAFADFSQLSQSNPRTYKDMLSNPRIYPNYFAPIITQQSNSQRLIQPMRYRIRPAGSREEVPAKYNVFNARLDALESRSTWRPLFMKRHGLLVFRSFFEWVTDPQTGTKRVLAFSPDNGQPMCAPVLYDEWNSPDGRSHLSSFAVITTEPPEEVAAQGHDRCPVLLRRDALDAWLNPSTHTRAEIIEILGSMEPTRLIFQLAA